MFVEEVSTDNNLRVLFLFFSMFLVHWKKFLWIENEKVLIDSMLTFSFFL